MSTARQDFERSNSESIGATIGSLFISIDGGFDRCAYLVGEVLPSRFELPERVAAPNPDRIVDVDRDGDPDIVVSNVGGPNAVYLNDGSATEWTVSWLGAGSDNSYGVDAGDLNGDGYPEIVFANSGTFNRLFFNVARDDGR